MTATARLPAKAWTKAITETTKPVMPAIAGRPATVRTSENKGAPSTAGMPETAAVQATAMMQATAVTPATSNTVRMIAIA